MGDSPKGLWLQAPSPPMTDAGTWTLLPAHSCLLAPTPPTALSCPSCRPPGSLPRRRQVPGSDSGCVGTAPPTSLQSHHRDVSSSRSTPRAATTTCCKPRQHGSAQGLTSHTRHESDLATANAWELHSRESLAMSPLNGEDKDESRSPGQCWARHRLAHPNTGSFLKCFPPTGPAQRGLSPASANRELPGPLP